MSQLLITHDSDGVVTGFDYPASDDYEPGVGEIALDAAEWDHREFLPFGCKRVDTTTDPPTIEDNPEHEPPDLLDRSEIDPALLAAYRDGADVWTQAKSDWEAARQDATDAATAYNDADTTQAMADALDARNDALQAQGDAVATLFKDGVIPALDALFQVAMGEEP